MPRVASFLSISTDCPANVTSNFIPGDELFGLAIAPT
jgi:hypothetical protein